MNKYLVICLVLLSYTGFISAQKNYLSGTVRNGRGPVAGATVSLNNRSFSTYTNGDGYFIFNNLGSGKYTLVVSSAGHQPDTSIVFLKDSKKSVVINLHEYINSLDSITISSSAKRNSSFTRLKDVEGTAIYAGKKTEVVILKDLIGNKSTNNSRQVYSKVAGLNIWENDGAGIQLAIGGRGLSPNRVANFNTRQNGYDISADALGYPESYYTPPVEAVERIEVVRGAASLQYGTQFGGMINFKMLSGSDTEKISLNTRLTGGSFGFVNTSTSVGGTVGNLNYVAFYQHKAGNGWRPNSDFNSNTAYASATYNLRQNLSVTLQYTHMDYLEHQPGGLTDADFATDPHQSIRARNWFKVNWNLGALSLDYKISERLRFNTRLFALSAERYALGILTFINRADDGSDRNLYIDHYRNWGNETRLLYQYNTGQLTSTALIGFRYYHGHTEKAQGFGNNGSSGTKHDFTFNPTLLTDTLKYYDYKFPEHNTALFAENIFRITNKINIIPGIRYEQISTRADGHYTNAVFDLAGNPISMQKIFDNKISERNFIIAGIGVTYNLQPDVQAYANFSQNYKAINFNDLRTQNPNLRVDSALHDEKGFSADLGIRKSSGILNYDINLFLINYDNKIGSILSVDTTTNIIYNLRTNVARSSHVGLESYVEMDIWKLINGQSAKTSVAIFSNFSLINAKYKRSKDPSIDGHDVEFVPGVIFKAGISFRRKKVSASYQFSYTGHQFTDATNATFTANAIDGLIPSYTVMDLSAEYALNRKWALSASINNLANNIYFTRRADSYPGPGIVPADARGVYITLQLHL